MGHMPLAFSVHNFISSVGADAGFAAIIGLAVLVLLYFAHARETANLREEAAVLAARLQQAEARVAELSRPQPVSEPVPVAADGVQVTDQRGILASAAPAGMAAPALGSATRVVPLASPEPAEPPVEAQPAVAVAAAQAAAAAPAGALATAGAATAAPATASAAGAPPAPAPAPAPGSPSPPPEPDGPASQGPMPIPGPATAAASGGNGAGRAAAPAPASAGAASGTASSLPSAPRGPARPVSPLPPRVLPPLSSSAAGRSSTARRVAIGLVGLALVAAVAVALVLITGAGSSTKSSSASRTTNAPTPARAAGFSPSTITVSVLNGTATNQLAHRVADKLAAAGYKEGRIATAANQTETTTVVAYLPGSRNRTAALHVASALNLRPTAVQPIDQATQQVACPLPTSCSANVVVTVGADLATL